MKKFFALSLFALSLFFCVSGCGGAGETSSVMEGADRSSVEAYEAAIAAQAAEMDASPPSDQLEAAAPPQVNETKK